MKTKILFIALVGISFGLKAQNTFPENGDVGINTGTDSPSAKLEIRSIPYGNNQDNGVDLTANYNGMNYWTTRLGLKSNSGGSPRFAITTTNRNSGGNITNPGSVPMEAFSILMGSGNIGIGTINPGSWKLAVNGNIRAKEIKVETGWSDFVFEKDYKLPTLKDVEKHINEKGHLKDIPSAEEVEQNGIFLGEMDSKLLQKIEELTLYTIQQQKEIESLKRENNEVKLLNKKLLELQKRLEQLEQK